MAKPKTPTPQGEYETPVQNWHELEWRPPNLLPDPVPDDGMVYRWVRYQTHGADDPANVSVRLREGWEPVRAEEQPAIQAVSDKVEDGTLKIGGLMLCKMPAARAQARDRYFAKQAAAQQAAVDNDVMRENNPRMPMLRPERKSSINFGGKFV